MEAGKNWVCSGGSSRLDVPAPATLGQQPISLAAPYEQAGIRADGMRNLDCLHDRPVPARPEMVRGRSADRGEIGRSPAEHMLRIAEGNEINSYVITH